jgi:dTDP-4-dehydrorhamnose reductase
MAMRFVIVGASGFLGGYVLDAARSHGHQVTGTRSRRAPSGATRGLLPFDLAHDRIEEVLGSGFFGGSDPVAVVICACMSQIDLCRREQAATWRVNVDHTSRLIADVAARGARVVFLSTSFVFDGRDGGYDERATRRPVCEYGRQKAAIEDYVVGHGVDSLIVRTDKVIGDRPDEKHVLAQWYESSHSGGPIRCIAGQEFSPTLVGDLADAIVTAVEQGLTGLYHVASPEHVTRVELAQRLLARVGVDVEVVAASQESLGFDDLRPLRTFLDGRRFVAVTGFRFRSSQSAIERFAETVQRSAFRQARRSLAR